MHFERALIHHLRADRAALVAEASRLLAPGGTYLVQDRTPEDSSLPGSPDYPRGYLFERFPRLLAIENGRRHGRSILHELTDAEIDAFVEELRGHLPQTGPMMENDR